MPFFAARSAACLRLSLPKPQGTCGLLRSLRALPKRDALGVLGLHRRVHLQHDLVVFVTLHMLANPALAGSPAKLRETRRGPDYTSVCKGRGAWMMRAVFGRPRCLFCLRIWRAVVPSSGVLSAGLARREARNAWADSERIHGFGGHGSGGNGGVREVVWRG